MKTFTFVARGRAEIPAIDMGKGLLRPVLERGQLIAQAAFEAEIDLLLGIPPKKHTTVTVVLNGGAPRVSGSVTAKCGPHRSKLWRVEHNIYELRNRSDRSWKSHRSMQYK